MLQETISEGIESDVLRKHIDAPFVVKTHLGFSMVTMKNIQTPLNDYLPAPFVMKFTKHHPEANADIKMMAIRL